MGGGLLLTTLQIAPPLFSQEVALSVAESLSGLHERLVAHLIPEDAALSERPVESPDDPGIRREGLSGYPSGH